MEHYSFHEGDLPGGYQPDFEETIFNLAPHRRLQAGDGWVSFFVLHNKLKRARAGIHFHIHQNVARSHPKSPFGSISFSAALAPEVLFNFIRYFETQLRQKGVERIVITNYPYCYQPDGAALVSAFLLNQNYQVLSSHVGSFFQVTGDPIERKFNNSTRYLLKKSREAGLVFSELPSAGAKMVYDFIRDKQEAKGYSLSMTEEHFERTVNTFPNDYLFFGVSSGDKLVSAAIVVKVNHRILYDYIHAHDAEYNHLSPVIFLVAGIYDYAVNNKFEIFDLGTSATEGQPDFPLFYFKRSLGAEATLKLTFEKHLR